MSASPGKRLRDAAKDGTIQVPGAFNALAARQIERTGFAAAYLSGAAFSAGDFALPDIGLFTLTELVAETRQLTAAVDIPLIVDADTGFGEALNLERAVCELEHAGAAAIQLEDQVLPKRCGHLSGKTLVSTQEMCAKIRAAVSARKDSDLVILARTDARGVNDLEDAIERAKAFVQAGADWVFPEALQNKEEFAAFAQAVNVPLVANMTEFGKSPLLTHHDLATLGYAAVLYPVTLLRLAMKQVEAGLGILKSAGTQESLLGQMQTRQELYDLLDYEGYEQRDHAHFQQPPSEETS
ncbi:MAG: methylisocitrate lyase [Pirellulales bacterium]|nr:methylisocitrate lyase [Pirellulales bacterium]